MNEKQISRYLTLVNRRLFILLHSGVDWIPEYAQELESIDTELAQLRILVEQIHESRNCKVY